MPKELNLEELWKEFKELSVKYNNAVEEISRLKSALPPTEKLRLLADWFEKFDYGNSNSCAEVQTDLREWAGKIDTVKGKDRYLKVPSNLDFQSLERLVNVYINELIEDRSIVPGIENEPINWGDLRCVSVEYIHNEEGDGHFSVLIEEASPSSCPNLTKYIRDKLEANGYDVDVCTEW